jgi:gliding motility-associated protein GldL
MTAYSKYNLVYRLQKWMDTVAGQTFLNYAYSWGASIVILGALFKLTHLPGANIMLFIGMGTEVFVFFISAFDRPFDKTADGRVMPTRLTEEFLETGQVNYTSNEEAAAQHQAAEAAPAGHAPAGQTLANQTGYTVPVFAAPVSAQPAAQPSIQPSAQSASASAESSAQSASVVNPQPAATVAPQPAYVPQMSKEEAEAMNQAQGDYVEELKTLVETLKKVNDQSSRLTRDSEEMENLNRTLTGISKIYEMQLKGASKQIGTIDEINAQTRKMAEQIDQLNKIYARMIEAMTVNMRAAAPGSSINNNE